MPRIAGLYLVASLSIFAATSSAQVYVTRADLGQVDVFNEDGSNRSLGLIRGLATPWGVAVTDTHVYVANYGNDHSHIGTGTIGKYLLDGTPVNTALVSGLNGPSTLAVDGGSLLVSNSTGRTIGEYGLDGSLIDASLITLGASRRALGFALKGAEVFVAELDLNTGENLISVYGRDGSLIDPHVVSNLRGLSALAVYDRHLFFTNQVFDSVGYHDLTTGSSETSLLRNVRGPTGIGFVGDDLWVISNTDGEAYRYADIPAAFDRGTPTRSTVLRGVHGSWGLAEPAPHSVPDDACTAALVGMGSVVLLLLRRSTRQRAPGGQ